MANQYEGSQVEIGPWLSRFTLPSRPQIMTVTHDMAGDWLDYRSRPGTEHQRKLSGPKVAAYTAEMNAGRWRVTPQGLIFDSEGWMFNGQHRMQALRNSELDELDFWVFPNEAADLFALIDTPAVRQARQLFNGAHATIITSAPRYLGDGRIGQYITTMTPAAVLEEVAKWPELRTHAAAAQLVANRVRVPGAPHLAILAQAERSVYRDRIPSWLAGLAYGANLEVGDPRLHVRNRYQGASGRRDPNHTYNLLAKAWKVHAEEGKMQILSYRDDEGTIPVVGLNPKG